MENIKQQIEECKKAIAEINQARDKTIKYFENKISELEQQVNKPKIEVGKVYRIDFDKRKDYNFILGMITEVKEGKINYYGFDEDGDYKIDWCSSSGHTSVKESTKEEWETALTKHADKLYEGVEKVDRSGMDFKCISEMIETLDEKGIHDNDFSVDGFWYRDRYVMDKHGVWAKPCEKIDCDLNIQNGRAIFKTPNLEDGKYKLVKVG